MEGGILHYAISEVYLARGRSSGYLSSLSQAPHGGRDVLCNGGVVATITPRSPFMARRRVHFVASQHSALSTQHYNGVA
jgi:hypothetical protein